MAPQGWGSGSRRVVQMPTHPSLTGVVLQAQGLADLLAGSLPPMSGPWKVPSGHKLKPAQHLCGSDKATCASQRGCPETS